MTSLVVQTSFLGDVVLTTPLIAELAARGPVDVLATPQGAAVLRNNPGIRDIITYDKRESGLAGFARAIAAVRRNRYDTAYLAQGSLRSALVVLSSGIAKRIGFNTSEGRRLYTHRMEYVHDSHHAERLLMLAGTSQSAENRDRITPRLFPSAADREAAVSRLREQLENPAVPFIVLAPGSAWDTKRWPHYPDLAKLIAARWNVAIIGGARDHETGEAIVSQLAPGRGANVAGKLGILASAALIGEAAAVVTNDSAPQHVASAMNTPTVSIFGPTVPGFGFGPLAARSTAVGNDSLACRPCDRHGPQKCPLGHWRCMREVSADSVFEILSGTLSQRAAV